MRQRHLVGRKGNPWLFPGETVGQPVREIRRFWAKVQKEADLMLSSDTTACAIT